jgi:hypothetical protein
MHQISDVFDFLNLFRKKKKEFIQDKTVPLSTPSLDAKPRPHNAVDKSHSKPPIPVPMHRTLMMLYKVKENNKTNSLSATSGRRCGRVGSVKSTPSPSSNLIPVAIRERLSHNKNTFEESQSQASSQLTQRSSSSSRGELYTNQVSKPTHL